jgi:hypothetical protein
MYHYEDENEKKRPPPIQIPPFPLPQSSRPQAREPADRNASNSTQPTQHRSNGSTPLTTPVEPSGTHLPPTGSGRSRKATFTIPADHPRGSSPRRSDQGSTRTAGSNHGSTTRSRQSGRSYRSAAAAQAQLEALDEETVRAKVEARNEKNLFKMTGQGKSTIPCA